MTMQAVTDFERGQSDFNRGLRQCPFKVQARKEAWLDGFATEAARYMRPEDRTDEFLGLIRFSAS